MLCDLCTHSLGTDGRLLYYRCRFQVRAKGASARGATGRASKPQTSRINSELHDISYFNLMASIVDDETAHEHVVGAGEHEIRDQWLAHDDGDLEVDELV